MQYLIVFIQLRKKRWEKINNYGIEAQNFDTARNLGINYIPCCKIVLMFYNTHITSITVKAL